MNCGTIASILILSIILADAAEESPDKGSLAKCMTCGIGTKTKEGDELIINGKIVNPTNRYPWMVALMDIKGNKFCGGAIISKNFILSAAHCVRKSMDAVEQNGDMCKYEDGSEENCYKEPNEVVIGFLTNTFHVTRGFAVSKIIAHPDFNTDTGLKNDIALLKLEKPIVCNFYKNPICLPRGPMHARKGTVVGVSGWGSPAPGFETETHELLEARITLVNPKRCYFMDFFREAKKKAWCLSGKGKQSPCFGDSGGSMFLKVKDQFYAMGVASAHSSSVCSTEAVVVYTMVHPYVKWIKKITGVKAVRPKRINFQ